MGGEHFLSYHDYNKEPCNYIHKNSNLNVSISDTELEIFSTIKILF